MAIAVTERRGADLPLTSRGRLAQVRTEGAVADVRHLARKGEGREHHGVPDGEGRVILAIAPGVISGPDGKREGGNRA